MAKVIHGNESGEQLVVTADKTQAYGLSGNDMLISGSAGCECCNRYD